MEQELQTIEEEIKKSIITIEEEIEEIPKEF